MVVRVHTIGSGPAPGPEDDEGAPPSGAKVHVFSADGEMVSSDSPSPAEVARQTAKNKAPTDIPKAGPLVWIPSDHDDRAARLRCLEMAAGGGEKDPEKILMVARQLYGFVTGTA